MLLDGSTEKRASLENARRSQTTNGGGKNVHTTVYAREDQHAHEGNETPKETLSETRVGKKRQKVKETTARNKG
jgi:hypothetical protein